jgi:hypothetical protein
VRRRGSQPDHVPPVPAPDPHADRARLRGDRRPRRRPRPQARDAAVAQRLPAGGDRDARPRRGARRLDPDRRAVPAEREDGGGLAARGRRRGARGDRDQGGRREGVRVRWADREVRIQSAADGSVLREEQAGTVGSTFVNDVALGEKAAYFTDSRAARIYELPYDGGPLRTIPLTGDFQLVPEVNNLNGIVASRSGWLVSVQTATGKLFRIDPATGATREIDLGGAVMTAGDGLLLEHGVLSVVQNRLNQIAQIEMSRDLLSGRVIGTLTDPDFDVPTTITRAKHDLYAVNARFGTPPTPDTTYSVVRVG